MFIDPYENPTVVNLETDVDRYSNNFDNNGYVISLDLTLDIINHVERFGGTIPMCKNDSTLFEHLKATARDFLVSRGWIVVFDNIDLSIVVL